MQKKQNIENVDDLLEQTKAKTIEFLQEHLEEQSLLFAKKRCQNTINNICNQPTSTIEEYKASLDGVVDIVNPQEEYNKVREELQKIIDDKDYLATHLPRQVLGRKIRFQLLKKTKGRSNRYH